jgi:hypothetical protein
MTNRQITVRMPKKDLELWLKALRLRSNQKKQGIGYLFNPDHVEDEGGYCCLGVAQQVCAGGIEEDASYPSMSFLKERGWVFLDHAGNEGNNPYFPSVNATASDLNDNKGYSFRCIATVIERHAEGY